MRAFPGCLFFSAVVVKIDCNYAIRRFYLSVQNFCIDNIFIKSLIPDVDDVADLIPN